MALWHIGIIYSFIFVAGMLGAKWASSFVQKKDSEIAVIPDKPLGLVVMLTLSVGSALFLWGQNFQTVFAGMAVVAMAGLAMILVRSDLTDIRALSILWVVSLVPTYCFPALPLMTDGLGGVFAHIGAAFVWAFLTWIFMQVNRVPFLSMSLSMGWVFAYLIVAFRFDYMPPAFGYMAVSLLIMQIGINTYLKKGYWPVLTPSASVFIGFMWAGLAVYMALSGYPLFGAMLYAYPIFEVLLSMAASLIVYRTLIPVCPFLIEKALSQNVFPEKALRYVMLLGIGFAGLAVSVVLPNGNIVMRWWLIATVVLLLHAYMRLNNWKEGRPKLRDLFRDVKTGLQVLKQEFKNTPFNGVKKTGVAEKEPEQTAKETAVKKISKETTKTSADKMTPVAKKTAIKASKQASENTMAKDIKTSRVTQKSPRKTTKHRK
ncbi:MAG: hypothetical protein IKY98_04965 [Alphaproteobacteria bacterium]|nr:hypothetical protein [Alphaproteobacteria bacterium]